jgi:hypothetical protein
MCNVLNWIYPVLDRQGSIVGYFVKIVEAHERDGIS